MPTKREFTDQTWGTYRAITEPDDPLDPATSMLARERNRLLRNPVWLPIWDVVDEVLEAAAEQASRTYDKDKCALTIWYHQAVVWRAKDVLRSRFEKCSLCAGQSPGTQAPSTETLEGGSRCVICGGSGRVLKEIAANANHSEQVEDSKKYESPCPACVDGEVGGEDCRQCGGTGIFLPAASDLELTLSSEQQSPWDSKLFAELEDRLPGWLPQPPDTDFVRDLAGAVHGLSQSNKLQVLLDEQLFAMDKRRTSVANLMQLAEMLAMSPEAIRTARGRIRARLRSVFEKYKVPVPESLADRRSATSMASCVGSVEFENKSRPPHSSGFKYEPTSQSPVEERRDE